MFLKIRNRKSNKEKKGGIFRKKGHASKDESPPTSVEQSLTLAMTLSEDSADSCGEPLDTAQKQSNTSTLNVPQKQGNVVMFTEQQVMENALRQMREVSELNDSKMQLAADLKMKHEQVMDLKHRIAKKQHLFQELKRTHTLKMTAKQEELYKMKNVLHELKQTYEQKLASKQEELENVKAESEQRLAEKETELTEVKTELKGAKDELVKVSSVLIGCQHELHDQKNKSFFFWC